MSWWAWWVLFFGVASILTRPELARWLRAWRHRRRALPTYTETYRTPVIDPVIRCARCGRDDCPTIFNAGVRHGGSPGNDAIDTILDFEDCQAHAIGAGYVSVLARRTRMEIAEAMRAPSMTMEAAALVEAARKPAPIKPSPHPARKGSQ